MLNIRLSFNLLNRYCAFINLYFFFFARLAYKSLWYSIFSNVQLSSNTDAASGVTDSQKCNLLYVINEISAAEEIVNGSSGGSTSLVQYSRSPVLNKLDFVNCMLSFILYQLHFLMDGVVFFLKLI